MQASSTNQTLLVREYPSFRAFSKDADELYTRTGYTVMSTSGMPQRGGWHAISFLWPREEHLVITYQAPTNPRLGAVTPS